MFLLQVLQVSRNRRKKRERSHGEKPRGFIELLRKVNLTRDHGEKERHMETVTEGRTQESHTLPRKLRKNLHFKRPRHRNHQKRGEQKMIQT